MHGRSECGRGLLWSIDGFERLCVVDSMERILVSKDEKLSEASGLEGFGRSGIETTRWDSSGFILSVYSSGRETVRFAEDLKSMGRLKDNSAYRLRAEIKRVEGSLPEDASDRCFSESIYALLRRARMVPGIESPAFPPVEISCSSTSDGVERTAERSVCVALSVYTFM